MKTIALLIKESSLNHHQIRKHYLDPLQKLGIDPQRIEIFPLLYEGKKVRAKIAKAYLQKLRGKLGAHPIQQLIIADGQYFKLLSGVSKVAKAYGEAMPCVFDGYGQYQAIYVPNWQQLFYDPSAADIITEGLRTVADPAKKEIITHAEYAYQAPQAKKLLDGLMKCHSLACDIETTGLALGSEIVSISFAWNEHQGIAIYCYQNSDILQLLREFFDTYTGALIFHRALFDVKHLIWVLYMSSSQDLPGMFLGLRVFRHVEDSQLMTYLALNSTADISLGLKENSYEYTGNYAVDVTNCLNIPPDDLLVYNLKDSLATWYVWKKYWPVCEKDDQLRVYAEILQPSIKPLLQMMLVGLPIDLDRVDKIEEELRTKQDMHEHAISQLPEVAEYEYVLQYREMKNANDKLKKKCKPFSAFRSIKFNPDSPQQVAELLYDRLGYPVLQYTDTKQPSTGNKVLNMLRGRGKYDTLINNLLERKKTSKILTSFIPAFKEYSIDGYLHGELNLGGTQSGRLSSTNPNLQNMPSGSTYGKKVKSCFTAKYKWLFWGIDFNALEERIGSILSGDPNRIKVYTQGFDGHSLRAFRYFGDKITGIDPEDPNSINSIEYLFPEFRKNSKAPTFALQYGGTYYTLMKNCGFSEDLARKIEKAYHELYVVSDQFMEKNMAFAEQHGYVECAFGLRLRTPMIQRSIRKSSHTPYAVQAEGRSANNAITQSWGLLVNRAIIDADSTFDSSPYRESILLSNTIHDAIYGIVRNDPEAVRFLNDTIVPAMEWNEDPKIKSSEVPMCAKLEIGYNWEHMTAIDNGASAEEIQDIISQL